MPHGQTGRHEQPPGTDARGQRKRRSTGQRTGLSFTIMLVCTALGLMWWELAGFSKPSHIYDAAISTSEASGILSKYGATIRYLALSIAWTLAGFFLGPLLATGRILNFLVLEIIFFLMGVGKGNVLFITVSLFNYGDAQKIIFSSYLFFISSFTLTYLNSFLLLFQNPKEPLLDYLEELTEGRPWMRGWFTFRWYLLKKNAQALVIGFSYGLASFLNFQPFIEQSGSADPGIGYLVVVGLLIDANLMWVGLFLTLVLGCPILMFLFFYQHGIFRTLLHKARPAAKNLWHVGRNRTKRGT